MVFGAVFVIILLTVLFVSGLLLVAGIICKIVGKVKDSKGARIAGTVFLIIALVVIAPVIALFIWGYFKTAFTDVNMPDGSTVKVYHRTSTAFRDSVYEYMETGDEDSLELAESLLQEHEELAYYRDANYRGILEFGIDEGNADVVRLALEYGAPVDCPERFDRMSYTETTWEEYLENASSRPLTEDDVQIAQMLFDADAETEFDSRVPYYSNLFGKAVWVILYNDETVSDTEMEFLQVFIDNGFDHDAFLMPVYEVPSNYLFGPETHEDVARDDNYYEVLGMFGY